MKELNFSIPTRVQPSLNNLVMHGAVTSARSETAWYGRLQSEVFKPATEYMSFTANFIPLSRKSDRCSVRLRVLALDSMATLRV